jgi:hypothetical protein
MKRFITTSLLAASLLLAGLGEARAFESYGLDTKTHPGSNCVRDNGPQPWLSYSAFGNTDPTFDLYADCPVVKDGGWVYSAQVRVRDGHASEGVSCTLYSVYRASSGGFAVWSSPRQTSVGYGTAPQTLYVGNVGGNSVSHTYLSCSIPDGDIASSSIDSYTVTEVR